MFVRRYFLVFLFQFLAPKPALTCYDGEGQARRCMPEFTNAALHKLVVSNNTCGTPPSKFCVQTGVTGVTEECHICDANDKTNAHPSLLITDIKIQTWWQSDTLLDNNKPVTLTLNLGKTYDVTYIRIRFRSSRPESMAIYKKTTDNPNAPWIPYQYFSLSCRKTYNLPTHERFIYPIDQQVALCTDKFSQIVPLTGGNVAFSTLEGRRDAYNFDESPVLQEWVTASAIRIDLDRINTFGDEVFGDPDVLRSYYFAIIDLAVGGRCKCNGHASECETRKLPDGQQRVECLCKHNTTGIDCDKCLPMYNDRRWARATSKNANPCVKCNCNGLADSCVYDDDLFRDTGHGGVCVDCKNNTGGIKCERCKENFFRQDSADQCKPCNCNPTGSGSLQCDRNGRCPCKPGVTGDKCDRCRPKYFNFGEDGCQPCKCNIAGTPENLQCDDQGRCQCKQNVIGANCDQCREGFFDLDPRNPHGCR